MTSLPLVEVPAERSCFQCIHHCDIVHHDGISSWCGAYEQPIDSETYEAEDCPTFEEI